MFPLGCMGVAAFFTHMENQQVDIWRDWMMADLQCETIHFLALQPHLEYLHAVAYLKI